MGCESCEFGFNGRNGRIFEVVSDRICFFRENPQKVALGISKI